MHTFAENVLFYEGHYKVWVKEAPTFLDTRRKFIENKGKTRNQSYASVLYHPQGTDATAQIVACPVQTTSSHTTPSWNAVCTLAEVTIQAKSHYSSFAPGIEICLFHLDLCDAEPSLIFCSKFTRKVSVLSPCLFQVIVESIIIQWPYTTIRSCLLLCLTH